MKWFRSFILYCFAVMMMSPILFVIIGSTQDAGWAFRLPIEVNFGNKLIENLNHIQSLYDIARVVGNSFMTAFITAALSTIVIFSASYVFAKYEFRYKETLKKII